DPRLRRALSVCGRQERRVRLPRGGARIPRRRLWRAASACLPGPRQSAQAEKALRPNDARGALVSRAGLSPRRSGGAALAPPGALQLAARLEGVRQANIISAWQGW